MPVDLVPPAQVWCCQFCTTRVRTHGQGVATPLHPCQAHAGFRLPMVAERPDGGRDGHVRLVDREDYVGGEDVQLMDGRPIMRAEVVREDGNDAWVYAPTAHASGRTH